MTTSPITTQRLGPPGRQWQVYLSGDGRPPVVLESALGSFGYQWLHVQKELTPLTRVLAYDRAGQGRSDSRPEPRVPDQLSGELHELLALAGIAPPYVVVGHSFGGLLARNFAGRYLDEVAGLVLVDSSHERQYDMIPNFERLAAMQGRLVSLLGALSRVPGLGRAYAGRTLGDMKPEFTAEEWDTLLDLAARPNHHHTVRQEFGEYRRYFGPDSEVPTDLGDLPVAVVVAENSLTGQRGIGGMTPQQLNDAHKAMQRELAETLSTQGSYQEIPGATHLSIVGARRYAQQVAAVIAAMVERLR